MGGKKRKKQGGGWGGRQEALPQSECVCERVRARESERVCVLERERERSCIDNHEVTERERDVLLTIKE
jgi:hypothetical protein